MRKLEKLWSVVAVLLLLLSTSAPAAFGQDEPTGEEEQTQRLYLPYASAASTSLDATDEATDNEPTDDSPTQDGLHVVDGAVSPISTVSLSKEEVAAAGRGIEDLRPISLIVTLAEDANADTLQALPDTQIVHRYQNVFKGVSLVTARENLDALANLTGVTGVYVDSLLQLDTDASPAFISAPTVWNALGGQQSAGEGVVVGILDSGVWPEHPSFSDPDPAGKPFPAPPGGPYACQFGSAIAGDSAFACNNKLVGAYRFMATYDAVIGLLPNEFVSARDDNGHGTHTATTSAGNAGVQASIFGIDRGIISGIAPRAHVINYKVCGDQGCFGSDSIAAIDQAIANGVNVINFSISGGNNPYSDAVELAFRNAYAAGVFVAASAGNSGPGPDTVSHRGPWVTTVAASTSNRHFLSTVTLTADNGDTLTLSGATTTAGISTPAPVVIAPDVECDAMPAGSLTGKIAICARVGARLTRGFNAAQAGAAGMLLYNTTQLGVLTDNHFLPSVHIDQADGVTLLNFMNSHTGVTGVFTAGAATAVPGDMMASFSSRGGPAQTLGVNKPDVTAPGVQILAGASPMGATPLSGLPGQLFQSIQGTSMSSPHVAGAAAILKDLHPTWTPGQIKSALMTTAKTAGVVKEDGVTPANSYDYGSGRIDLSVAGNPGITFDETAANYATLQNALWNANYPSFYHPALPGAITVQRTAKDVLGRESEWRLNATTDNADWKIVVPKEFKVKAGSQTAFTIAIEAGAVPLGQVRRGMVTLTEKKSQIQLHIPVTFVRGQAAVTVNKSCTPVDFKRKTGSTACTITMQNTTFSNANVTVTDHLPEDFKVVPGTLAGGSQVNPRTISFSGALSGAVPPQVSVAVDPAASPAGYLPLSGFGVAPISGLGDDTLVNFNVPSFTYAGETYTRLGISSNGVLIVGGGTAADATPNNAQLPSANTPNNILAPFWTDLNPAAGGAVRIGALSGGGSTWVIVDWEKVPNFSNATQLNSLQVWIRIGAVEDISFTYGPEITTGDNNLLTVGAENRFGNSGGTIYFNGTGQAPAPSFPTGSYEIDVFSVPGAPGAIHTITFSLTSDKHGRWQNCANLTADIFQGIAISCVNGNVTR